MGILLWVLSFLVFIVSPVTYMADSRYSMLTAQSLLENHTPDLSSYKLPDAYPDLPFNTIQKGHAYQLERRNGHLLYGFPHGTSFLSLPFVALMNALGVSAANSDRSFNLYGEFLIQRLLAAILMATFVVIAFGVAGIYLSPGWSALLALGAGFGTQIWSTASREMWSHTWEITLGIVVVLLLLRAAARNTSLRPVWLATLLAWMYFVRPTGSLVVIAVSGYVLLYRRSEFLPFAITGLAWLAAFIAYNLHVFGALLPSYYTVQIWHMDAVPVDIYRIMLSPSRGLFVFCPIFAVTLYMVARYWRSLPHRPLATVALLIPAGIVVTCAANLNWGGGWCYGPRYMTDTVPWFVLMATLALAAMPNEVRRLRSPQMIAAALALLAGVAINGNGALSWATAEWNRTVNPQKVMDWSQAQFLATSSNLKLPN